MTSLLPAMGGIGYRQFAAVVRGRLPGEEALGSSSAHTVRYAKRQMTWASTLRDPESADRRGSRGSKPHESSGALA